MGVTLHFQSTGTVPGQGAPVRMTGPSLTIGRGAENDLCLPDPGKTISKVHCAIEDRGGDILIVDHSTNGTFLNYGKFPIGPVPAPLNDGDILTLGPYELLVEIVRSGRAPAADPLTAAHIPPAEDGPESGNDLGEELGRVEDRDFLDDLLGDAPLRGHSGIQRPELGEDGLLAPLGEDEDDLMSPRRDAGPRGASVEDHAPSVHDSFAASDVSPGGGAVIPDDWDDLLAPTGGADEGSDDNPLGGGAPAFIPEDAPLDDAPDAPPPVPGPEESEQTLPPAARQPASPPPPPPAPAAESPAPPSAPASPADTAAARAFLEAAGAEDLAIPDADLPATMARLGGVFRTMVTGLREILMTRASIKSEFRIQQTMIRSGGNNPLKFSISPEMAVEAMVKPTSKGYLESGEAAREALDDIKAHEVAMMSAMDAALKGVLKQLSPEVLEGQIAGGGGLSSLLKGKKARYWEVYETMYARISDQAENDFHELFSREFARAYQAQMERLK
ncbi:type VI secretion system-associated FHA domain protein TagH [Oceaniglobus roseus]|uniref:type VI secretion system-associated FHA domain protein TagH n=1 Tax=Oceaniglobus roseus TaxID=1737570 RepID=UPI000C7EC256|nr:type VI secretion system-associated FHA domain protein TagH [Kandeliimicrobium roseum]